jgi:hypothetical protein
MTGRLLCSRAPVRLSERAPRGNKIMPFRAQGIGFIAGCAYALVCAALFSFGERSSIELLEFVSLAMIVGTPIAVGVVTVFFGTEEQVDSVLFVRYGPWLSVVGWSAISIALEWETIICVVMLLPIYMPLATVGGLIGAYIRKNYCNKTNLSATACIAVLPIALGLVEFQVESPIARHTIATQIRIAAPAEAVWAALPNVRSIESEELPWTLSHALGIPRPVSATTENFAIGGIRRITWEQGVQFEEKITGIENGRRFSYDVLADEQSMTIAGLDTHVVVGGEYFEVESGEYSLQSDGKETTLVLATSYRIKSNLNWYGTLWANFVLDDFHTAVLTMLRDRIENPL